MTPPEICYLDATELAARIRAKQLSPCEVVQAHLDRITAINSRINAVGPRGRRSPTQLAFLRGDGPRSHPPCSSLSSWWAWRSVVNVSGDSSKRTTRVRTSGSTGSSGLSPGR